MINTTFSAVLLAGGESKRMGTDKALLKFGGVLLWERQMNLLRAVNFENIFVSARSQPSWLPPGTKFLPDTPPSQGPLSGLIEALRSMKTTHLLTLAIDLPQMTIAHLQKLQDLVSIKCGAAPRRDGRFEPLTAIYPAETLQFANVGLTNGDTSLQNLITKLVAKGLMRPYDVAPNESALYLNCNSPTDLP